MSGNIVEVLFLIVPLPVLGILGKVRHPLDVVHEPWQHDLGRQFVVDPERWLAEVLEFAVHSVADCFGQRVVLVQPVQNGIGDALDVPDSFLHLGP